MLWIMSRPISTAAVGLPGMPKANVGMMALPMVALFADSAAMTPLMFPFPNVSLSGSEAWVVEYASIAAALPPAPGVMPSKMPNIVPRIVTCQ